MMRQDSGGRHHVPSPSRGQDTLFQFRTAKLLKFLRTVKSFRAMKKIRLFTTYRKRRVEKF